MKTARPPASRQHDAAVVELLKEDPEFASVYLAAALEKPASPAPDLAGQKGGAGRCLNTIQPLTIIKTEL